jgi:hypothetical protein
MAPVILVVSNAEDVTADFFAMRLEEAHIDYVRLDTENLARQSLSFGVGGTSGARAPAATMTVRGRRIPLDAITAVYYRRPLPPTFSPAVPAPIREWMENEVRSAWGGTLGAWPDIRWMNHPLAVSGASYKPEQLGRAYKIGLSVPHTLLTTDPGEAAAFCDQHAGAVVVKPVGHGEIRGDDPTTWQLVFTNRHAAPTDEQLASVAACPTLFQQAIEKDVDVRVTIAGDELFAVALHSQERTVSTIDCRRDNMSGMRYSAASLPTVVAEQLLALTRSYGLLYAAIDLVRDQHDRYWFLEINPSGQWAWLEQVGAARISDLLISCLTQT